MATKKQKKMILLVVVLAAAFFMRDKIAMKFKELKSKFVK